MEKRIKFEITNLEDLKDKIKKAHDLSEELACTLNEIDKFEPKILFYD
jgi:phage antirepressor YoqD-like protein